jgi:hypothetical protein
MSKDKFGTKLEALGYKLSKQCIPASEKLVREYEKKFSLILPDDYREFLANHGGVDGTAICPFQEPTPVGKRAGIERFYGFTKKHPVDIHRATEMIDGAPAVVAIASAMGGMIWLKCTGRDGGYVYFDDGDGRSAWPDKTFYDMFPGLAPEIKEYLELRRNGQLPKKPKGYEHAYRLASSFTGFMEALQPFEEE